MNEKAWEFPGFSQFSYEGEIVNSSTILVIIINLICVQIVFRLL